MRNESSVSETETEGGRVRNYPCNPDYENVFALCRFHWSSGSESARGVRSTGNTENGLRKGGPEAGKVPRRFGGVRLRQTWPVRPP